MGFRIFLLKMRSPVPFPPSDRQRWQRKNQKNRTTDGPMDTDHFDMFQVVSGRAIIWYFGLFIRFLSSKVPPASVDFFALDRFALDRQPSAAAR